nr:hypothetical protein [Tanacetum cinerariifolium]
MESLDTREYPSLIHTFFLTHTVGGVFLNPEDKALYALTPPRVCPTPTMRSWSLIARASNEGHIPGVGSVLPGQGTLILPPPPCTHTFDVVKLKKSEKRLTHQVNMLMKLFRSDAKFSQMLTKHELQPEYDGDSGSGRCGDDEPGDDEDGGEDEEDTDS